MHKLVQRYRQSINPPWNLKDYFNLISTFTILLAILLTAVLLQNQQTIESQAQTTGTCGGGILTVSPPLTQMVPNTEYTFNVNTLNDTRDYRYDISAYYWSQIYYQSGSVAPSSTITFKVPLSFTSNINPGEVYHFRVFANCNDGTQSAMTEFNVPVLATASDNPPTDQIWCPDPVISSTVLTQTANGVDISVNPVPNAVSYWLEVYNSTGYFVGGNAIVNSNSINLPLGPGNYALQTNATCMIGSGPYTATSMFKEYNFQVVAPSTPIADTIAPKVSLALAGTYWRSGDYTMGASATDNYGVTRVDWLLDGVVIASDSTEPYNATWNTVGYGGVHTLTAKAYDAAGNVGTSAPVTINIDYGSTSTLTPTLTPTPIPTATPTPVPGPLTFSSITANNITTTSAKITWTTSGLGTSRIAYGTTVNKLTSSTSLDSTLVTQHTVTLTGLSKSRTYYYKAYSKNAAGTEYSSSTQSFKTAR